MNENLAQTLEAQAVELDRVAASLRLAAAKLRLTADDMLPSVPSLLSIKEASDYSGLTVWAIRQLLSEGMIAEVNIGRRRFVPKAAVDAFAKSSEVA